MGYSGAQTSRAAQAVCSCRWDLARDDYGAFSRGTSAQLLPHVASGDAQCDEGGKDGLSTHATGAVDRLGRSGGVTSAQP
eukprot:3821360-Prymnesium_polylepis.1